MISLKGTLSASQKYSTIIAIVLGVMLGYFGPDWTDTVAKMVSDSFMRLLKFISLPIISLSLISTISGLDKSARVWALSKRVTFYTVLTTVISASFALLLYELVSPVNEVVKTVEKTANTHMCGSSYLDELLKIVPNNIIRPFVEDHVLGVFVIAILIGLAALSLPEKHRKPMHESFQRMFLLVMQLTKWIIKILPIAIIAFVSIFIKQFGQGFETGELAKYFTVITSANIIHASILLPLILLIHKIPVFKTFRGIAPALSLAFFSKSSSATMPSAIQYSEERLKVSPEISRFTFPLCTTINMNACAAFILTTVMFVAENHGVCFTFTTKLLWVGIATITAIGNAGVPMGCFFLSNALLTAFNVPVEIMGIILPFYGLLDMLESAVNIWSDTCVTVIVDKWWKNTGNISK